MLLVELLVPGRFPDAVRLRLCRGSGDCKGCMYEGDFGVGGNGCNTSIEDSIIGVGISRWSPMFCVEDDRRIDSGGSAYVSWNGSSIISGD
jgi:hypothetical protein